jgi:hypothetical protein
MLAGLITGTLAWAPAAIPRSGVGTALLALVMVPMSFVGSMLAMGVALFVAGFAIAPTLIALFAAIEHGVPAARLTEGIAITHTGLAAGLAPGAALAGRVFDAHGASPSYLVRSGAACSPPGRAGPARSFDPLDASRPTGRWGRRAVGLLGATMFTTYRRILSVPGALRFSGSALVARLPISMDTIGIVLLVTGVGRSYGLAGAMSAAYLLAAAALAIPQARLVDRLGQRPVLLVAAAVFAVAMTAFVVVVQSGGPIGLPSPA